MSMLLFGLLILWVVIVLFTLDLSQQEKFASPIAKQPVFVNVDFVPSYNSIISKKIKIYPNPAESIINIVTRII